MADKKIAEKMAAKSLIKVMFQQNSWFDFWLDLIGSGEKPDPATSYEREVGSCLWLKKNILDFINY